MLETLPSDFLGTLVLIFAVSVASHALGWWVVWRDEGDVMSDWRRLFWFRLGYLKTHVHNWKALVLAGFVWSGGAYLVSSIVTVMLRGSFGVNDVANGWVFAYPGAVSFFLGGALGVAGVLNTLLLLQSTTGVIATLDALRSSVDGTVERAKAAVPFDKAKPKQDNGRLPGFLVEYSPRVGDISGADTEVDAIKHDLDAIRLHTAYPMHYLFLPPQAFRETATTPPTGTSGYFYTTLEEFYNHFNKGPVVEKAISAMEELDKNGAAVWLTDAVGMEHYFVLHDRVVAYAVFPSESGTRNIFSGMERDDHVFIRHARSLAERHLSNVVTPQVRVDEKGDLTLTFRIGQFNVAQILIDFLDKDHKKIHGDSVDVKAFNAKKSVSPTKSHSSGRGPSTLDLHPSVAYTLSGIKELKIKELKSEASVRVRLKKHDSNAGGPTASTLMSPWSNVVSLSASK